MFQSVLDTPRPDSMPFQTSIASRAQIGVAPQQPRWKLFSQPHRKSLHNRCVRAGEFASFKSCASLTRCTFARARAASDDEEAFIEVVDLDWTASDATSVLESDVIAPGIYSSSRIRVRSITLSQGRSLVVSISNTSNDQGFHYRGFNQWLLQNYHINE
ncbi:hypothetical protein P692DRAFT_20821611 [Suillus brevipes Sb2]|nr:hypothetical protein P692DRAFT_20821611 [Suillus brevipes Sb2]